MHLPQGKTLVLFDGYCHLCCGLVVRIIRRDLSGEFIFAPIDSKTGKLARRQFNLDENIDSIIVVEAGRAYVYSEAVLRVAAKLDGPFKLLLMGRILPRSWRDQLYRWIARNRVSWFGKRNSCYLPNDKDKERFLS